MEQELSYLDMVAILREKFPEFEQEYQEHNEVYKELLAHLLITDFAVWLAKFYGEGGESHPNKDRVQEILNEMESLYVHGNDHVKNIIAVSFMEDLPSSEESSVDLRELLGPTLKKVYWEVNW